MLHPSIRPSEHVNQTMAERLTSTNAFRAVNEQTRNHRNIPFWFHRVAIVNKILEDRVVLDMKHGAGDCWQMHEDIMKGRGIFISSVSLGSASQDKTYVEMSTINVGRILNKA